MFSVGAFNFAFVLIRGSGLGISDSMVLLLSLRDNKRGTHARRLPCRRAGRQDWQGSRAGDLIRRVPCKHGANADKHELSCCLRPCRSLWCAYIDISETVQRALVPKYTSQASSAVPPMACTICSSGFHFLRRTLFLASCLTRQAYSGRRDVQHRDNCHSNRVPCRVSGA
jgi:hypothetical protein